MTIADYRCLVVDGCQVKAPVAGWQEALWLIRRHSGMQRITAGQAARAWIESLSRDNLLN